MELYFISDTFFVCFLAGFSEAHLDPHLQAAVKQVNRLTAPKRKSHSSQRSPPDPVHSAVQAQLKAHLSAAASSVLPSSTSTPNSKTAEKPRKAPRVVAQGRKPSKPGANSEYGRCNLAIGFVLFVWLWCGEGGFGSMFTQHCTEWHDRLKRSVSMVETGFKRKFRNGIQKEV